MLCAIENRGPSGGESTPLSLLQFHQENQPGSSKIGTFEKALFAKIGRYQVMFGLAPHLEASQVVNLVGACKEKVEAILKAQLLSGAGTSSASSSASMKKSPKDAFDPLWIREWCHLELLPGGPGIGGVGQLEWTESQRDYMYAVWEAFNSLVEEEAEVQTNPRKLSDVGGPSAPTVFRRVLGAIPHEDDYCAVCPAEIPWTERLDSKMKELAVEHFSEGSKKGDESDTLRDLIATLRKRQDYMDQLMGTSIFMGTSSLSDVEPTSAVTASVSGNGGAGKDSGTASPASPSPAEPGDAILVVANSATNESNADSLAIARKKLAKNVMVLRDLLLLSDHLHISLPDLARRVAEEMPEVSLIPRVAPHVSAQYRSEQKDFFLLENMRRIHFERKSLFDELIDKQTNPEDTSAGGLQIAKCGPGCACGAPPR